MELKRKLYKVTKGSKRRKIKRINKFETERKNIHHIQKKVHKKYFKLYGRNDAYFRKLNSKFLSINN